MDGHERENVHCDNIAKYHNFFPKPRLRLTWTNNNMKMYIVKTLLNLTISFRSHVYVLHGRTITGKCTLWKHNLVSEVNHFNIILETLTALIHFGLLIYSFEIPPYMEISRYDRQNYLQNLVAMTIGKTLEVILPYVIKCFRSYLRHFEVAWEILLGLTHLSLNLKKQNVRAALFLFVTENILSHTCVVLKTYDAIYSVVYCVGV